MHNPEDVIPDASSFSTQRTRADSISLGCNHFAKEDVSAEIIAPPNDDLETGNLTPVEHNVEIKEEETQDPKLVRIVSPSYIIIPYS